MKIVFVSGFLNNHLLPVCEELKKYGEFSFVATQNWQKGKKENKAPLEKDYVIHDFVKEEKHLCEQAIITADIAIFGGNSDFYLNLRKKNGGLIFIYSENILKKGKYRICYPPLYLYLRDKFIKRNNLLYVLCASSYLANDLRLIRFPKSKCFKFGYYPKLSKTPFDELLASKSFPNGGILKLLYVGRLLDWKCVDKVIRCAYLLYLNKVSFELHIIGEGPEFPRLRALKDKLNLDNVFFHGLLPNSVVTTMMKSSDILYLSSSRFEGWGAVVNEAMGNACVVIESIYCGSANYLISNGVNGYIAQTNSEIDLFRMTMNYININNDCRLKMHSQSYKTIWENWNAKNAVERLMNITQDLINNKVHQVFENGPLSQG